MFATVRVRSGVTFLCVMAIFPQPGGPFLLLLRGDRFCFFARRHIVGMPGVYLVGKVTSLLDCANLCSLQMYRGAGSPLIAHSRCDFSYPSCCSWLLSVLSLFAASAVCARQSLLYLAAVLSLAQHLLRGTSAASYALRAPIPTLGIGSVRVLSQPLNAFG